MVQVLSTIVTGVFKPTDITGGAPPCMNTIVISTTNQEFTKSQVPTSPSREPHIVAGDTKNPPVCFCSFWYPSPDGVHPRAKTIGIHQ